MLHRAGLSKSQRHTVFFNAGAVYGAPKIEKVLKHMFKNVVEEDTREGKFANLHRNPAPEDKKPPFKKKWFPRSKRGALMADGAGDEGDEDPAREDEDADEDESEGEDDADDASLSIDELKEAWAEKWSAKSKVALQKKSRGFLKGKLGEARQSSKDDPRKKKSICSSCGNRGHWKGDTECPKVKDGTDKAHVPKKVNDSHFAHFVGGTSASPSSATAFAASCRIHLGEPGQALKVPAGKMVNLVGMVDRPVPERLPKSVPKSFGPDNPLPDRLSSSSSANAGMPDGRKRDANAAALLITPVEIEIKKAFDKERKLT
jgi:hypothetical protein